MFVNGVARRRRTAAGLHAVRPAAAAADDRRQRALRQGANAIAIVLADGWFRGQTGAHAGRRPVGHLDLGVGRARRRRRRRGRRPTSRGGAAPSHISAADLIAGQTEDRRRFDPAVLLPGFDDSGWNAGRSSPNRPTSPLVDYDAPPVRRVEELVPSVGHRASAAGCTSSTSARTSTAGHGSSTSARRTRSSRSPTASGWTPDGDVTTDHLQRRLPLPARAAARRPGRPCHLRRARRRRVRAAPDDPRLPVRPYRGPPGTTRQPTTCGASSCTAISTRTGWFECDDERINRLHDAAVWSLRDNICEIPTDCPHRERAGWTGDWQIFAPTAAFLYDVERVHPQVAGRRSAGPARRRPGRQPRPVDAGRGLRRAERRRCTARPDGAT